jgi:hypothetical protein
LLFLVAWLVFAWFCLSKTMQSVAEQSLALHGFACSAELCFCLSKNMQKLAVVFA